MSQLSGSTIICNIFLLIIKEHVSRIKETLVVSAASDYESIEEAFKTVILEREEAGSKKERRNEI
jgi:hypothetical protein